MRYHIVKLDGVAKAEGDSIRYLGEQPYMVTCSKYSEQDACFSCNANNKEAAWIRFVVESEE